jgi:hypothetical protein
VPLVLLLLATAPAAGAQGPGLFEIYVSRKSTASDPLFGGLALAGYSGIFGLRLSGGLHLVQDTTASQQALVTCYGRRRHCGGSERRYQDNSMFGSSIGGWTADADLIVAPLRTLPLAKALLLGFSPYAFVGIGGDGTHVANVVDTSRATLSYGAGVHHELLGWLGLDAEARYRRALHGDSTFRIGSPRDWTYRAGLTISFGGGHHDAAPATPQVITLAPPLPPLVTDDADAEDVLAARAAKVLDRAEGLLDTPYRRGGSSPASGFDAAGFVRYVIAEEGVSLPRTAGRMSTVGRDVSTRVGTLRPGDLLFFANDGLRIDHVAIYVGQERIVHASASGGGVRYDDLGEGERGRWFAEHLMSARRVLAGKVARSESADAPLDEAQLDPPDRAPRTRGMND